MHAVIRHGKLKAGMQANFLKIAQEGADRAVKAHGLKSYYAIAGENGEMTTITVFDDKAAAEKSGAANAEWMKANLLPLVDGEPVKTEGTIVVSHKS